jgi:predicted DNA-binding ribbon-helix-helix protein
MTEQAHIPNSSSGKRRLPSPVSKRTIKIAGHTTSISLEPAFITALKEIAVAKDLTVNELVGKIDKGRQSGNLSSAIRQFVLAYYQAHVGDQTSSAYS